MFLTLINLTKIALFITFIFLAIMYAVSTVSNILITFTPMVFVYLIIANIVITFLQDMFAEKDSWTILKGLSARKDSKVKLELFGFKWNSIFNH